MDACFICQGGGLVLKHHDNDVDEKRFEFYSESALADSSATRHLCDHDELDLISFATCALLP